MEVVEALDIHLEQALVNMPHKQEVLVVEGITLELQLEPLVTRHQHLHPKETTGATVKAPE
jgi:hypothetical protein